MDVLKLNLELINAVLYQNLERVAYLLEKGADATYCVNSDADSLLYYTNNVQIASLLIDKGAKVNARNLYRKTPLHIAVEKNNLDLVSLFLKNGASMSDVEVKSRKNLLSIAISNNYFTIVKLLIEFGYNIHESMNMFFDNALHLALKNKEIHLEMVSYFLEKGVDANVMNSAKDYPIHIALKNKSCSSLLISKLVQYGADINCRDSNGNTPLHCIVGSIGNVDFLKVVLQYLPISNSFNNDGLNPLHLALKQHVKPEIIRLLLSYSCSTNVFDMNYSCDYVPIAVLKSFQSGNFVNVCNRYGDTPLYLAMFNFLNVDIIEELLQYGASTKGIALTLCNLKPYFIVELENNVFILKDVYELLLKYAVINQNDEEFLDTNLFENSISNYYLNLCQAEVSLLEKELGFSLLELSNLKNTSTSLTPGLLEKMMKIVVGYKFPIYKRFIQKQFKRSDLLNMLLKQKIFVNVGNQQKSVCLDWASVSHLAKYLINSDLLNLTAAFYTFSSTTPKLTIKKKNKAKLTQNLLSYLCNYDTIRLATCANDDISMFNSFHDKHPLKLFDCHYIPSNVKLVKIGDKINKDTHLNAVRTVTFEYSCKYPKLLNAIKECEPVAVVESLLKRGYSIFDVTKRSFNNALHLALQVIHNNTLNIVRMLLKYGLKANDFCNYADKADAIPVQIVKSLKSGLFVNIVNADGNTPMHLVLQHSLNNSIVDIIKELLIYGGDLTSKNNLCKNPLFYFIKRVEETPSTEINKMDITKELLKVFIKFGLLNSNFDVQIFTPLNSILNDSFICNFTFDCRNELSLLEKESISDTSIEILKIWEDKCVSSGMISRIFEICDKHEYPIYEDLLVSKINRLDLLKQLIKPMLSKLSYQRKTNFAIASILPRITQYLNKQDLLNWNIAFAVQSNVKGPSKCVSLKRSTYDSFSNGSYTATPVKIKKFSNN